MEKLILEYLEKFDENFPLFMFMGVDEEEIIKTIKRCIDENKPYIVLEEDNNVIY